MKLGLSVFVTAGMLFTVHAFSAGTKNAIQQIQQKNFDVKKGECGVSRFSVLTQKTESINMFGSEGITRTTQMAAVVELSSSSCIPEFAVVQWIKGCVFESTLDGQTVSNRIHMIRDFKGNPSYPFKHPEWTTDTIDTDPVYSSLRGEGLPADTSETLLRFGGIRFPRKALQLKNTPKAIAHDIHQIDREKDDDYYLFNQKPRQPIYYVSDLPASANYSPIEPQYKNNPYMKERATNTSLQFKTCLYRAQNVPVDQDPLPEGIPVEIGGPIQCFDWNHQNVFNHVTKQYESPAEAPSICSSQL